MASAESYTPWVIGAMDRLWFQKAVLLDKDSVAITSPNPCSFSSSSSSSQSQTSSNSSFATTDCSEDDDIAEYCRPVHGSLPIIPTNLENYSEDEDDKKKGKDDTKGTRSNLVMKRAKSSSTSTRRRMTKTRAGLERTKSCMSPAELELEEVKGFMDLGFNFDKERLTPRMISVIPGLQRLSGQDEEEKEDDNDLEKQEEDTKTVEEAKKKPYLSEAWMINRPDFPLLRLRISRVSTNSSDMKKNLKLWAKTVAHSANQQ